MLIKKPEWYKLKPELIKRIKPGWILGLKMCLWMGTSARAVSRGPSTYDLLSLCCLIFLGTTWKKMYSLLIKISDFTVWRSDKSWIRLITDTEQSGLLDSRVWDKSKVKCVGTKATDWFYFQRQWFRVMFEGSWFITHWTLVPKIINAAFGGSWVKLTVSPLCFVLMRLLSEYCMWYRQGCLKKGDGSGKIPKND